MRKKERKKEGKKHRKKERKSIGIFQKMEYRALAFKTDFVPSGKLFDELGCRCAKQMSAKVPRCQWVFVDVQNTMFY